MEGAGAGQVYMSTRLNNVAEAAFSEMKNLRDEYLSTEHLLLAIADEKNGISARILKENGVSKDATHESPQGSARLITRHRPES